MSDEGETEHVAARSRDADRARQAVSGDQPESAYEAVVGSALSAAPPMQPNGLVSLTGLLDRNGSERLVSRLQGTVGNTIVSRLLALRATISSSGPGGQMQSADDRAAIDPELQRDIHAIKDELDSLVYTEGVERAVLEILDRWATRGTMATSNANLERIFDALRTPKPGLFSHTTYYDAMLDRFDNIDAVRRVRDRTPKYVGVESESHQKQRTEQEAEDRDNVDLNTAEVYELPPTIENVKLAELAIARLNTRLNTTPARDISPIELAAAGIYRQRGAKGLLMNVHWVTASERAERRKAAMRAVARPFLELLLWETGMRLGAALVEATLARLFVVEVEAGAAGVSEGAWMTREKYAFQIQRFEKSTGMVEAIGRDGATGEVTTVRLNIDTGSGVATRASGETLRIEGGRLVQGAEPVEEAAAQRSLADVVADLDGLGISRQDLKNFTGGKRASAQLAERVLRLARHFEAVEVKQLGEVLAGRRALTDEAVDRLLELDRGELAKVIEKADRLPEPSGGGKWTAPEFEATPNFSEGTPRLGRGGAEASGSDVLGQALIDAGHTPSPGYHAHHIIPENAWGERLEWMRNRLRHAGSDINHAENGVFLAARGGLGKKLKATANVDLSVLHNSYIHAGETKEYAYTLTKRLYDKEGAEFLEELQKIGDEMRAGSFRIEPIPHGWKTSWEPGMSVPTERGVQPELIEE